MDETNPIPGAASDQHQEIDAMAPSEDNQDTKTNTSDVQGQVKELKRDDKPEDEVLQNGETDTTTGVDTSKESKEETYTETKDQPDDESKSRKDDASIETGEANATTNDHAEGVSLVNDANTAKEKIEITQGAEEEKGANSGSEQDIKVDQDVRDDDEVLASANIESEDLIEAGLNTEETDASLDTNTRNDENDASGNEANSGYEDANPKESKGREEVMGENTSTTASSSTEQPTNLGAQILMNRFSTWRKTANERFQTANERLTTQAPVLQENAKQASEYAQRVLKSNTLPSFRLGSRFASQKQKSDGANEKEPMTEHETDREEENHATDGVRESKDDNRLPSVEAQPEVSSSGSLLDDDDDETDEDEQHPEDDERLIGAGTTTVTNPSDSRERARAIFSRASESVATSFRGRYTIDAGKTAMSGAAKTSANEEKASDNPEASQIALILKSRAGEYMKDILDKLESFEYAMLLGKGMLGVNLKQCYLKNHGIFVDYLVDGGQAAKSGLIRPGDLMVSLGDVDFRKGTIKDIPLQIAKAKRPSVLVLATGTQVPLERINYVDVAVAMMHRARKYYEERGSYSILPSTRTRSNTNKTEMKGSEQESASRTPPTEKEEKTENPETPESVCGVAIDLHDTVEAYTSPPWPALAVRKEFTDETSLRSLDNFVVSDLCEILDMDTNFRAAIRNAFLVCALDSRRLPFLARHFSNEEQKLTSNDFVNQEDKGIMNPSAQLMLFLELASFLDLYDITPPSRLRDAASRIAYKFFLPTKVGNGIQPPLFDFHQIVSYSSLRHLEFALNGKSQSIPRDLFLDFQKSIVDTLSGAPFVSFLASSDCSRMRAYVRDTAPFLHLPFKSMMNAMAKGTKTAIDTAAAHNAFTYILLYLICRMEKESSGEYDFMIEKEQNRRLLGATHDVCCALFIRRSLLPTIALVSKEGETLSGSLSQKLLNAVEKLWDLYLADSLELSTRNAEIEGLYDKVRNLLLSLSKQLDSSSDCAAAILESGIEAEASILADEILFDYAANVNSKFRDHKFHEWMCGEFSKVLAGDPYWHNTQSVPVLPQGCLKRLLRKAELPSGVSSHKPYHVTPKEPTTRTYHNADWAVVFGSSVGTSLASQMAVPGLDSSDIRRYTCLPVALDREYTDFDDFRPEQVLPATFESYAFVPPSKPKPFQSVVDCGRVTADGWEVSLVTFSIPNADSTSSGDSTESALYGVSLCFQQTENHAKTKNVCKTNLVVEAEIEEAKDAGWNSPISFEKASVDGNVDYVRNVRMPSKIPIFEEHLQGQTWVDRVENEEYRDKQSPISIGIALVSRRNVIFAMRDTLSRLFFDYSRQPTELLENGNAPKTCGALVELLGAFSYQDHERSVLKGLLEPYLKMGASPWTDRPLYEQETMFESHSLRQLTDCLPPTSLALLFVTALLEQKIIFSSGRRSVLHAASVGLATLLRPLKWSHLLVPMVPGALANDLIQYPAPFILGVPSEDADSMDLLGNLPRDVTLVDLDVGRVILAPEFGKDNEMCRGTIDVHATARALRSQVLYLAQGLGVVFGNSLRPDSWISDEPSLNSSTPGKIHNDEQSITSRLDHLRSVVKSFVGELLEGSVSCCYWIEEIIPTYGVSSEPTVLFDEDKFFEIKNQRASRSSKSLFSREETITGDLALVIDDFDLVLESFLRCQSMSIYISSRPKEEMFYF